MNEEEEFELAQHAVGGDARALLRLMRERIAKIELPPLPPAIVLPSMPTTYVSERACLAPGTRGDVRVGVPHLGAGQPHMLRVRGVSLFVTHGWSPRLEGLRIPISHGMRPWCLEVLGRMIFVRPSEPPYVPAMLVDWRIPVTGQALFELQNPCEHEIEVAGALHGEWLEPEVSRREVEAEPEPPRVLRQWERCRFCAHQAHATERCGEILTASTSAGGICNCRGG